MTAFTDMQAAIGLGQLGKLEEFIKKRKENFSFLYNALKPLEGLIKLPKPHPNSDVSWFGFPIYVNENSPISRNEIIKKLDKKNIGTRLLFGGNILKQPAYSELNCRIVSDLPITDKIMENVFWIGVQPSLSKDMIEFVVNSIIDIFKLEK